VEQAFVFSFGGLTGVIGNLVVGLVTLLD